MISSSANVPRSGFYYFSQGWKLVSQPGIRRFVILPLLVNILLMGGAFWWLFTQLDTDPGVDELCAGVVTMAELHPLAIGSDFCSAYFWLFLFYPGELIAAPFNGLLAEQLEARLTGATPPDLVFSVL